MCVRAGSLSDSHEMPRASNYRRHVYNLTCQRSQLCGHRIARRHLISSRTRDITVISPGTEASIYGLRILFLRKQDILRPSKDRYFTYVRYVYVFSFIITYHVIFGTAVLDTKPSGRRYAWVVTYSPMMIRSDQKQKKCGCQNLISFQMFGFDSVTVTNTVYIYCFEPTLVVINIVQSRSGRRLCDVDRIFFIIIDGPRSNG